MSLLELVASSETSCVNLSFVSIIESAPCCHCFPLLVLLKWLPLLIRACDLIRSCDLISSCDCSLRTGHASRGHEGGPYIGRGGGEREEGERGEG